MTNYNELLELCKQVYKATGWYGSGGAWRDGTPLYTSDYLLEKLPDTLPQGELFVGKWGHSYWRAGYFDYKPAWSDLRDFSDTPLKALLKLTIKLHQENIL